MSAEPLFCTHCGAEDFACDCESKHDGTSYCEVSYEHFWTPRADGSRECTDCGIQERDAR